MLSFFLGSSLALFLAIGVLLCLPEKSVSAEIRHRVHLNGSRMIVYSWLAYLYISYILWL